MTIGAAIVQKGSAVHLLFVDESGTAPTAAQASDNPVFVMGGLVVPEAVWPELKSDFDAAKRSYGVTGEIKWRFFSVPRVGSKPNSLSHLDAVRKEGLRTQLLRLITTHSTMRVIAVVVDTEAAYRRVHVNDSDDLYHDAFKALTERFQHHLQDLERESDTDVRGMIVCDNRNNDQDHRLKAFHHSLLTGSERYASTYTNLVEGLFIAASHHSVGTQFADLVAGAVFRAEARGDRRFVDQLIPSFRTSSKGRIEGFGVVRIPKREDAVSGSPRACEYRRSHGVLRR